MLNFKQPTWAHAELFGHASYFCRAQEVNFCGSHGLAIEPVTVDGILPAFFAAGAAIFRLTPMSEDDVRHAALPRAFRACETFQAAPVLLTHCRVCGRDEPEHEEERQRKALPPSPRAASPIPDAEFGEELDDDIPFDGEAAQDMAEDRALLDVLRDYLENEPRESVAVLRSLTAGHDRIEVLRAASATSERDESLTDGLTRIIGDKAAFDLAWLEASARRTVGPAALQEMGWTQNANCLWVRSPPCPRCGLPIDAAGYCSGRAAGCQGCRAELP